MATPEPLSAQRWSDLLAAVHERDVEALVACFVPQGRWQNVPHDAWVGRETIASKLGPILLRSDRVQWDVVSESYSEHRAWLERVDRFWIDGTEYSVRVNGVIEIDPSTGLIAELRDYSDLGEWRARLARAGDIWSRPADS